MTTAAVPNPSVQAIPPAAILCLSLAAFSTGISMRVTDALLPHLAGEFSLSLGSTSYIITCFAIAYGVAQLFFGPLGDRFGKYLVIAWACVACAITATLCGLAPNFPALLAARLLAGATAAAIIPLSMAWIGDVIAYENRQSVLARFLIGQILGLSTGVLLGGYAADHLNWRIPFFGIGLFYAVVSVVLMGVNGRLPEYARQRRKPEGHALKTTFSEFSKVLAKPWARRVLGTVFLEGVFLYGAFAFIASHLHQVHDVSLTRAGSLVMLFGFGGFLFAMFSAQLVRRLGEVGLTWLGGSLMAGALLAIGAGPSWQWAIPGCFMAGFGFYMFHNTLQINATQMAPERRGVAVSAFASCFFFGQSVGIAIGGLLVEHVGTGALIVAGSAGVLIVALNFSRLRSRSLRVA